MQLGGGGVYVQLVHARLMAQPHDFVLEVLCIGTTLSGSTRVRHGSNMLNPVGGLPTWGLRRVPGCLGQKSWAGQVLLYPEIAVGAVFTMCA